MPHRVPLVSIFLLCSCLGTSFAQSIDFKASRVAISGSGYIEALEDVNADGTTDVLARTACCDLNLWIGDGKGGFTLDQTLVSDPHHVTAATASDVNNDGLADLAMVSYIDDLLMVRLADGAGGYAPANLYATRGNGPIEVGASDLNGDGDIDLVIVNQLSDSVTVYLGAGDGSFPSSSVHATGQGPSFLEFIDANGDGNDDLVVTDSLSGSLTLLLGDGTGAFPSSTTIPAGTTPWIVSAVDLDGNEHVDLAVLDAGSAVILMLGDGAGGFIESQKVPVPPGANHMSTGDVNHDGISDIAVAVVPYRDQLLLIVTDGQGKVDFTRTFVAKAGVRSVYLFDVDSDGHLDLFAAVGSDSMVFYGNGTAGFGLPRDYATVPDSRDVALADVDLDGRRDVILAHYYRDKISVSRAIGGLQFEDPVEYDVGDGPQRVLVTNLREDTYPDIVVPNRNDDTISVLLGTPDGTFQPQITFATGDHPVEAAAADFNDDSHTDIVIANEDAFSLTVLFGTGTGGFSSASAVVTGARTTNVATADFDSDGHQDIACAHPGAPAVAVLWGAGDGTFPASTIAWSGGTGAYPPTRVLAADLTGDGGAELLFSTPTGCLVLDTNGRSFFLTQVLSAGADDFTLVDFDEDGRLDLAQMQSYRLRVAPGLTDGTFGEVVSFGISAHAGALAAEDMTGDGHADLIFCAEHGSTFQLLRNRSLDYLDCRRGNVNAGAGAIADVLLVNSSPGTGTERTVSVDRLDPLEVRMEAPPSRPAGPSGFALYVWSSLPESRSVEPFPFQLGNTCMPTLAMGGLPMPLKTWNNLGYPSILGKPDLRSTPAPSIVLSLPNGLGRPARVFLQGVIRDSASIGGEAAITNGIALDVQ